jgi:hypothetical protein
VLAINQEKLIQLVFSYRNKCPIFYKMRYGVFDLPTPPPPPTDGRYRAPLTILVIMNYIRVGIYRGVTVIRFYNQLTLPLQTHHQAQIKCLTMVNNEIKIILGGGRFMAAVGGSIGETIKTLKVAEEQGIKNIDTAYIYAESEVWLGEAGAPSRFFVDTKHPGGLSSVHATAEDVLQKAEESLKRLKIDFVRLSHRIQNDII